MVGRFSEVVGLGCWRVRPVFFVMGSSLLILGTISEGILAMRERSWWGRAVITRELAMRRWVVVGWPAVRRFIVRR